MRDKALELRLQGYGYGTIARLLGNVSAWTVRNWVRHIKVDHGRATALGLPVPTTEQLQSKQAIRKRLIAERGHRCERCELETWLGQPIMLEVHNHRKPKLRQLMCPNCHAQTDDWRRTGA